MRSRTRNSSSVATSQIGQTSVEAFGNLVAPLQVSAQHDFRVTAGLEAMAEMLERVAQLHEVISLAGINERGNDPPLFFGLHRLHAAGEVDDGEAAMPKADMPIDENAFRIRAAQSHRFRHLRDDVPSRLDLATVTHPTSYAAHRVTSLARPRFALRRR